MDGKVLIVKYGNNSRRIHKSKAVKEGNEFQKPPSEHNNDDSEKSPQTPTLNHEPSNSDVNIDSNRKKRKTSIRRPDKNRRVQFKVEGSSIWNEGEITEVGDLKENDMLICKIKLDNGED